MTKTQKDFTGEETLLEGFNVTRRMANTYPRADMTIVSTTKNIAATQNYTAEDVIASASATGTGLAWTFDEVVSANAGYGAVVQAQVFCQTTAQVHRVTLYLFNATPTSMLDDNSANTAPLYADLANYVGRIDFPAFDDLGGFSATIATPSTAGNLPLYFQTATADDALYGILVARDAFTGETANDDYTVKLYIERA